MAKTEENKAPVSTLDITALEKDGFQQEIAELRKLDVGQQIRGEFVAAGSNVQKDGKVLKYYEIVTQDGALVRLNGVTHIEAAFDKIPEGSEVIVFRGDDTKTNGGRWMHTYKVLSKRNKR